MTSWLACTLRGLAGTLRDLGGALQSIAEGMDGQVPPPEGTSPEPASPEPAFSESSRDRLAGAPARSQVAGGSSGADAWTGESRDGTAQAVRAPEDGTDEAARSTRARIADTLGRARRSYDAVDPARRARKP